MDAAYGLAHPGVVAAESRSTKRPQMLYLFDTRGAVRAGLLAALVLALCSPHTASAQEHPAGTTNAALVRSLKGFQSGDAEVNGVHLHYVAGGTGTPLILLPGWPETWWQYHKIMPSLARHFHVVSVDIRGMGLSSKPVDGYDKKTMAKDIYELVRHLGYDKVDIAGHDIGSMVAFAYAAQFPQATLKLAMMDVPHPDDGWMKIPMLPQVGKFGAKIDDLHPAYPWFSAFQQVKGLLIQSLRHMSICSAFVRLIRKRHYPETS
jgi:pimeloyl-ACP methyl ester carboxylesterase